MSKSHVIEEIVEFSGGDELKEVTFKNLAMHAEDVVKNQKPFVMAMVEDETEKGINIRVIRNCSATQCLYMLRNLWEESPISEDIVDLVTRTILNPSIDAAQAYEEEKECSAIN